jgi:hypothetical protein
MPTKNTVKLSNFCFGLSQRSYIEYFVFVFLDTYIFSIFNTHIYK